MTQIADLARASWLWRSVTDKRRSSASAPECAFTDIPGPDRALARAYSRLRSSYLGSMVPWLGAGELLNLAAGWAPDDAGTGSSSPSRASVLFRLTVPFGANAPYSLAASPFR